MTPIKTCITIFALTSFSVLAYGQAADPQNAQVRQAVAPNYPALATTARISDTVRVRVIVDSSGTVGKTEVIEGNQLLRKAAAEAAAQWKFEQSNSSSQRAITLEFSFVLLPEQADVESKTKFIPPYRVEVEKRPAKPSVNY